MRLHRREIDSDPGLRLIKDRATINDFIVERAEPLIEN
jgi:hypothetical protein